MGTLVQLKNAILAYPHLFEKHKAPGSETERYGAEFILDGVVNQDSCQAMHQAFIEVATAAGKGEQAKYLKSPLQSGDKINENRLASGKEIRPEIAGKYVVRAYDRTYSPQVVSRDPRIAITAEQKDQIFGGCVVNGLVDLYWTNTGSPGVYAGLRAIQLVDNVNVTPIGGVQVDATKLFEKLEGPDPLQAAPTGGPSRDTAPSWA
jgi:hypothetical protein